MARHTISRRHFFFGTLLAGAIPRAGFGSVPSLKALGYQSPNEKLNIAGIGAGGQPFSDLRQCETENIVALADVDWVRGEPGFQRWDKAAKYKDFRQMLDKAGQEHRRGRDRHPRPHAHLRGALLHGARQGRLRREAADADRLGGAAAARRRRRSTRSRRRWATRATRTRRRASRARSSGRARSATSPRSTRAMGRPSWPQGMTKIAAADAGAVHARLGPVAGHRGRPAVHRRATRSTRTSSPRATRRAGAAMPAARRRPGAPAGAPPAAAARPARGRRRRHGQRRVRLLPAVQLARLLRLRQQPDRRLGRPHPRSGQLGPVPDARAPGQRRVRQEGPAAADHVPGRVHDQVRVQGAQRHAAGHGLLVSGTRAATRTCRRA